VNAPDTAEVRRLPRQTTEQSARLLEDVRAVEAGLRLMTTGLELTQRMWDDLASHEGRQARVGG
jgi:hypothetical protein